MQLSAPGLAGVRVYGARGGRAWRQEADRVYGRCVCGIKAAVHVEGEDET